MAHRRSSYEDPVEESCKLDLELIRTLYGYNRWATERLFEAARDLTGEQLDSAGRAGHGSIRETLVHAIGTQRGWLAWWDGSLSAAEAYALQASPADYPDLASVRALWEQVEQRTAAFLDQLTSEQLASVYLADLPNGQQFRPLLWQMMLHVANHGTQHRAEAAAMMTAFGCSPGDVDLLWYAMSRPTA